MSTLAEEPAHDRRRCLHVGLYEVMGGVRDRQNIMVVGYVGFSQETWFFFFGRTTVEVKQCIQFSIHLPTT